jgi:glycosyltransferase involved in cell wall biosynthesis
MKVLLLVQKEQRVILDRLYESVAGHSDCEVRLLEKSQQASLKRYFDDYVDQAHFDRIVLFLRVKLQLRQASFIRTIDNLVFLEHDACQNYYSGKYQGAYSKFYSRMPWARVISSGYEVARRLRGEGFDAVFVSKGYDQVLLKDFHLTRDIELAFIGSTKNQIYRGRSAMLESIAAHEKLNVMRTESGEDYLKMLNRIRFFLSADVDMGEYMIKNFEAMACGCVLFAYDQGESENRALGLVDMENIVLYRTAQELSQKLAVLRSAPDLVNRIACAGKQLAEQHYTFYKVGARIVEALRPDLRPRPDLTWFDRFRAYVGV